jgi:hypothetical protein
MQSGTVPYALGSFRDRGARVLQDGDRILRALSSQAAAEWRDVARSPFYEPLVQSGRVVASRELSADETLGVAAPEWTAALLQHERIPFISYPYEWSFGMLRAAALLHLQILSASLPDGVILKDASPYNVQFRGSAPVFIDIGSFELHQPQSPWVGYRQFCELMLIPLFLQAYRGVDFQPVLRGLLEGLPADRAWQWFSLRDGFRPGVATHVWLHGWMQRAIANRPRGTRQSLQASGFSVELIQRNLRQLTRLVERLTWKPPQTSWTDYDTARPHVRADRDAKSVFVRDVCGREHRNLVWDLGCNHGTYSRIAAEFATTVVAMDQDHGCIERLFLELQRSGPGNILPLRMELANPSPAHGWRGRERLRLEERGRPELVLCLGLIHHLVIGNNLPLADVVDWLAELGGELVLEFPTKADPLVQVLLSNKHDQYADYSLDELMACLDRRFHVRRSEALPSGERTLFHAQPRS